MLAVSSPEFAPLEIGCCEPGRLEQPAGYDRPLSKARRFARQRQEDRLSDLFRVLRIAHLAQRYGINDVDVPGNKGRKRILTFTGGILPDQIHIADVSHFTY